MKKALLTLAVVVAMSVSVFAQGTVLFNNNAAGKAVKWGPGTPKAGQNVAGADGIIVQLLWLNTQGAYEPVGAPVETWPLAGTFNGGTREVPVSNVEAPGWTWQVRAWEKSYGTDWNASYSAALAQGGNVQALSGVPGATIQFQSKTGDPTKSLPAVGLAPSMPVFTIMRVPEPSVIALGVLGLGALLMLRRRS